MKQDRSGSWVRRSFCVPTHVQQFPATQSSVKSRGSHGSPELYSIPKHSAGTRSSQLMQSSICACMLLATLVLSIAPVSVTAAGAANPGNTILILNDTLNWLATNTQQSGGRVKPIELQVPPHKPRHVRIATVGP
jgi:hypothetical protein